MIRLYDKKSRFLLGHTFPNIVKKVSTFLAKEIDCALKIAINEGLEIEIKTYF